MQNLSVRVIDFEISGKREDLYSRTGSPLVFWIFSKNPPFILSDLKFRSEIEMDLPKEIGGETSTYFSDTPCGAKRSPGMSEK